MKQFQNLPLNRKLTLIIMLTTAAAMMFSAVAIITYQIHTFSNFIISELETTAEILAANGSAALRFDVPRDASTTLSSLEAKPHISGASFFTPEGRLFATYSRDDIPLPMPSFPLKEGHTFDFDQHSVILIKGIQHDGDFIGSLLIQSDLAIFYDQLYQSIATILLIIVACSALALILAFRLLRVVSQPITGLMNVVNQVSEHRDYSLRAKKYFNDDLGLLTEGFNDMLHQIQIRDTDLQQEISDRKRAESSLQEAYGGMEQRVRERTAEISKYRENLEELVADRTAELKTANEQLRQEINDRMQAEDARRRVETELENQRSLSIRSDRLRSLGEMAAGMAHELNQPLTGVRILSEHTLIEIDSGWEIPEHALKKRMQTILEQTDRMVHIIQHVRMFAREAGKPDLSDVSINKVVTSSLEMLGAQFRSHGIQLEANLTEGLPLVRANQYSLEEVLLNLLSNARDAVGDRSGEEDTPACVTVQTDMNGRSLRVQVTDNGIGISSDILDRLFDPFFTTKDPDKGTGLGLPVSKSIVESFGGTLTVQSESGNGSIFTITLPIQPPMEETQ